MSRILRLGGTIICDLKMRNPRNIRDKKILCPPKWMGNMFSCHFQTKIPRSFSTWNYLQAFLITTGQLVCGIIPTCVFFCPDLCCMVIYCLQDPCFMVSPSRTTSGFDIPPSVVVGYIHFGTALGSMSTGCHDGFLIWPFQDPKLEVPTIWGLNFRQSPQKIWPKIWYERTNPF